MLNRLPKLREKLLRLLLKLWKMLKANTTNRKFYNKWLYKVTLNIPGVAVFRLNSLEKIPFLNYAGQKHSHSTMARAALHKQELIALSSFLLKWDSELWSKVSFESASPRIGLPAPIKLLFESLDSGIDR
jgi:hypothetical protein